MKPTNTARRFGAVTIMNCLAGAFIIMMSLALSSFAQMAGGSPELQQKFQALKQASAENKQRLMQYQWVETTVLTYKGEDKPPKQDLCRYGPNGQVQKVPIGEPQQPQQESGRRGRVKEHVVEKKTEEMQDYMQQVKGVISLYVPPDPQRMQKAFEAHNVSLNSTLGSGAA